MADARRLSHVVGFDDAPFARSHRGDVPVVGVVYAGLRLEGVLVGKVRRDGANATGELARMVAGSRFRQLQLILLQGIAVAGFNVVDVEALARRTGLPVLAVSRRAPRFPRIRAALLARVRGGARKWALIEQLGPMERVGAVHVQRVGLSAAEAAAVVRRLAVNGHIPEPLRAAHLIAGALGRGESRGRV
jgi:endonuclease V-like protein UPF0215 family